MGVMASKRPPADQALSEQVGFYTPLVKKIAQHLVLRLPAHIMLDDLIQAGMLGLMEAVKHYDPQKGASFETYASIRIRGYMLDEVRRGDWIPRSIHRNSRRISEAEKIIQNRSQRHARPAEIAKELGVPLEEYYHMVMDMTNCRLFGVEDIIDFDETYVLKENAAELPPEERVQFEDFSRSLSESIKHLPERERLVLSLYYDHELNLKEIGKLMEVSESRVSQIHSQAMERLQVKMRRWTI